MKDMFGHALSPNRNRTEQKITQTVFPFTICTTKLTQQITHYTCIC